MNYCPFCGAPFSSAHACATAGGTTYTPVDGHALRKAWEARAELERRTVELLERLLRGEIAPGFESLREQAGRKKFEDDARALLAEWKVRP